MIKAIYQKWWLLFLLILFINEPVYAQSKDKKKRKEERYIEKSFMPLYTTFMDSTYDYKLKDQTKKDFEQLKKSTIKDIPFARISTVFNSYPVAIELISFLYFAVSDDTGSACKFFKSAHDKYTKTIVEKKRSVRLSELSRYQSGIDIELDKIFERITSSERYVDELRCLRSDSLLIEEQLKKYFIDLLAKYFDEESGVLDGNSFELSKVKDSDIALGLEGEKFEVQLKEGKLISNLNFDSEEFVFEYEDERHQYLLKVIDELNLIIEDLMTLTGQSNFFQVFIQGQADPPDFQYQRIADHSKHLFFEDFTKFDTYRPNNTAQSTPITNFPIAYRPRTIRETMYNNALLPDLRARTIQILFHKSELIVKKNLQEKITILGTSPIQNAANSTERLATIILVLDRKRLEDKINNTDVKILKKREKFLNIIKLINK